MRAWKGSRARAIVAVTVILIGFVLGLVDIGVRWLEPGTDPIFTYSNVHPPQYADSELADVFDKYDAVFVGTVIGFNEPQNSGLLGRLSDDQTGMFVSHIPAADGDWRYRIHGVVFRVDAAWKGARRSELEMPVGFDDSDFGCGGRHFDVGFSYLVYAKRISYPITYSGSDDFLTSQCDPTTLFPYKYDPVHQRVYDLPNGIPDLNLEIVGDGYTPSERVNLLRSQPPLLLIVSGVLLLAGVLIMLWPRINRVVRAIAGGSA